MENRVRLRVLHIVWIGVLTGLLTALSGWPAMAGQAGQKILLEIEDGDTAFVLDPGKNKAWWLVGQCQRPIPMKRAGKSKNPIKSMSSEIILDNVRIGDHQIVLRQQFRFTLADTPNGHIRAEVYNSLRGGWSEVPVRIRANCAFDAKCRARMDVPEC